MYSIQEILSKTEEQRKEVRKSIDSLGGFDPCAASIYSGQKRSIQRELQESIRRIPLKEFLISGLAGASYLIPSKLADVLYRAAQPIDIAPLIAMEVINGWSVGGDLKVAIPDRYSLKASLSGSGGSRAPRTPSLSPPTTQPTIVLKSFSVPLIAESSMVEDSQFPLVEWYVKQSAYAIAMLSNDLILTVLKTGTDGIGTINSSASGDANETKWSGATTMDIERAIDALGDDEWVPNTMIVTPQAWRHSIEKTVGGETAGGAAGDYWQPRTMALNTEPPAKGFHLKVDTMDVLKCTSPSLHSGDDARGATFTGCVTIIFDRAASLIVGRKRWMLIENYVDPVKDLEGAVVSCRQGAITAYNDSIYVLTET